ncbi:hypothetical protein H0H92_006534 [Tricholoma furcatifolium]|nr:hypothetical protein H0H92_006534 [Tricholoma furcatifolium]
MSEYSFVVNCTRHIRLEKFHQKRDDNFKAINGIGKYPIPRYNDQGIFKPEPKIRSVPDAQHHLSMEKVSQKIDLAWTSIAALISRTTQHKSLTFSCHDRLPTVLLRALQTYPTIIDLSIPSWNRTARDAHDDPVELALASSPFLTCLHASIHDPEVSPGDLRLPALFRIARGAPNLQYFSLDVGWRGLVVQTPFATSSEVSAAYKMIAAEFKRVENVSSRIRHLRLKGKDLQRLDIGTLSGLETLDFSVTRTNLQPLDSLAFLPLLKNLTLRGQVKNVWSVPTISIR